MSKKFEDFIHAHRQSIPDDGFTQRVRHEICRSEQQAAPRVLLTVVNVVAIVVLLVTTLLFSLELNRFALLLWWTLPFLKEYLFSLVLIAILTVSSASLVISRLFR